MFYAGVRIRTIKNATVRGTVARDGLTERNILCQKGNHTERCGFSFCSFLCSLFSLQSSLFTITSVGRAARPPPTELVDCPSKIGEPGFVYLCHCHVRIDAPQGGCSKLTCASIGHGRRGQCHTPYSFPDYTFVENQTKQWTTVPLSWYNSSK